MFQAIVNIFKIGELRSKVLFTLGMLVVYRIGFWIPVPGVNQSALKQFFEQQVSNETGAGRLVSFVAIFSGGQLGRSTIFGLGIMPYISASIILMILAQVYEPLKKIKDEGPTGQQKITEWTRYITIGLCLLQGFGWLAYINRSGLIYPQWASNPLWWVMAIIAMTAGTTFLMWLGEQIDRFGIGNGVSLLITAGILARMPQAFTWVVNNSPIGQFEIVRNVLNIGAQDEPALSWMGVILLAASFVFVVAGSVIMTVAQRRIPIQQAKHTRGRRVYGGQRSYLPLRVNHGGVMPIIFASSLMIFPSAILGWMANAAQNSTGWWGATTRFLSDSFAMGEYPYVFAYILMIYIFSYFWTTIQFNPEDMAKQLRDHGSFIPGLRPGPRTAQYLETVLERLTYVGAGFLSVIAVIPMIVNRWMNVDFSVAQFLGGTGLLIVVAVGLDFIQRIEAHLVMRNYAGFLGADEKGRQTRVRGRIG